MECSDPNPIRTLVLLRNKLLLLLSLLAFLFLTGCKEPTLEISGNQAGFVGEEVTLSATVKYTDEDVNYVWTLLSRPQESILELSNADRAQITFTPDVRGEYRLSVTATTSDSLATYSENINVLIEKKPELVEFNFGELRGRFGHQGIFPIRGSLEVGPAIFLLKTKGDVESITVRLVSSGARLLFSSEEPKFNFDKTPLDKSDDFKKWEIEGEVPIGGSTMLITLHSSSGKTVDINKSLNASSQVSIKLYKSDLSMSWGEYFVIAKIKNSGESDVFTVTADDTHGFISDDYNGETIAIGSGEEKVVKIPLNATREQLKERVYRYSLTANLVGENSQEHISASITVGFDPDPIGIDEKYESVLLNLEGGCAPVEATESELKIVLVGSKFVFPEVLDLEKIIFSSFNGSFHPTNIEIRDVADIDNKDCTSTSADGIDDIILTFSLGDLLSGKLDTEVYTLGWQAHINFKFKDSFIGDAVPFTMDIKR